MTRKTGLVKKVSPINGMGGLFIVYQSSAMREYEGQRGLSHLAEHLLCKSYDHLNDKLQSAGITSNAYTSDNNVVFFWTGLNEKIEQYQQELLKLTNYIPKRAEFEMEKNIVIAEYKDCVAEKNFLFSNIGRKYYNYFGPIGCLKDLEDVTYEKMLEFIVDRFVHPTSIVRIGESSTIDALTKNYQYMPILPNIEYELNVNPNDSDVVADSTFPTSKLMIEWAEVDNLDARDVKFIQDMLSSGLNSPLYQEIREKRGLVYYVAFHLNCLDEKKQSSFYCECSPEKEEEIRSVFKDVLRNWKQHLTPERFDVVLESKMSKELISEYTDYKDINDCLCEEKYILNSKYLKNLTYEHIYDVIGEFVEAFESSKQASISDKVIL